MPGPRGGTSHATEWRAKHPERTAQHNRTRREKRRGTDPAPAPVHGTQIPRDRWADTIIEWAPTLTIPSGMMAGAPFVLPDWQADWLRCALAEGVRVANMSVARKNGKTGVIAVIALAFLAGPLNTPGWRAATCSLTAKHAKELSAAIVLTAQASGIDGVHYLTTPAPGEVRGHNGARLQVLAADKSGGESLSNDVVMLDEVGLYPIAKRELVYGMRSSLSARDGMMLNISVKGDSELFSEFEKAAESDPAIYWREWAADPDAKLDDPEQWAKANPGLGTIKSLSYMEDSARFALAAPSNQNEFASRELNLPRSPEAEPIVGAAAWLECLKPAADLPPREGPCVLGFDAGASTSMTAAAAMWENGRLEAWAAFPSNQNLLRRGDADNVGGLYQDMANRGELRMFPGTATPIDMFLDWVRLELADTTIAAIGCDRYRQLELQAYIARTLPGVSQIWRGTGASAHADGSHDVRCFQRMVLKAEIATDGGKLLLTRAIAESKLRYDLGKNPALDKVRERSRIDALQAAVIAAGMVAIGYAGAVGEWDMDP